MRGEGWGNYGGWGLGVGGWRTTTGVRGEGWVNNVQSQQRASVAGSKHSSLTLAVVVVRQPPTPTPNPRSSRGCLAGRTRTPGAVIPVLRARDVWHAPVLAVPPREAIHL